MRQSCAALAFGASIGILGATAVHAQCTPEWLPTPGFPGVTGDGSVTCATTWDPDGAGPAEPLLVLGGQFEAAGNVLTGGLAAWNGQEWSSLNGPAAEVLAVYNGDLVVAGGFFTAGGVPAQRIARYDGTAWHPLGGGLSQTVRALAVYNGELIAGGFFTDAGGGTADYIARWNGTSWLPLGSGVNDVVTALTVHNGDLFVGGGFNTAGGQAADNVARWNGSAWQGFNDAHDVINVHALHVFQGELIASGTFIPAGTGSMDFVVRWTGSAWQELGGGTSDHIFDFFEYNKELICSGLFHSAGGVSAFHLAKWNGSFWSPVFPMVGVDALTEYRGDLIVGGRGLKANQEPMSLVLRWDGASVGYVGRGTDEAIFDFETYAGDLIAAGEFSMIGNTVAAGVARWSQGEWHAMGGGAGVGAMRDLAVFDGALIASGTLGAARWDGASWHPFGSTPVAGMFVHEGFLHAAIGLIGPNMVGRWNPATTSWDVVGQFPEQVFVGALTSFNGDLVAGGFGNNANVWRLDEGSWVPIGGWMGLGSVSNFAVYNGELVACGRFSGTSGNILNGGSTVPTGSPSAVEWPRPGASGRSSWKTCWCTTAGSSPPGVSRTRAPRLPRPTTSPPGTAPRGPRSDRASATPRSASTNTPAMSMSAAGSTWRAESRPATGPAGAAKTPATRTATPAARSPSPTSGASSRSSRRVIRTPTATRAAA